METMAAAMLLSFNRERGTRHWTWKAEVLIDTILIAEVASAKYLQEVVVSGLQIGCLAVADRVKAMLEIERQMPSAPSVSRH